ncbi:MAG: alpha/beta hydrolase [Bacteroidetes bacterium 4572_117]|nr:MAG: alpha/beta hydrolase [Bacteroidetes bacterium 4572_117]
MLKTIFWILALIAIFIVIILLILYLGQEKLIFHPEKLPKSHKFLFKSNFEEHFIKVDDKIELNALYFKADSSKGLVFYLHGNAGNLDSWGEVADLYLSLNYDVFIVDYRGYGKSNGKISSQPQFRRDIQKAYDFATKNYDENKVVIIGYSIGTGPAAKLASKNKPAMLILKAPYYSLMDLIHHYLPFIPKFIIKYRFRTNWHLKKVSTPVYVFHGTHDKVIYYKSSVKLKKRLKQKITLITLRGQEHNGINDNSEYVGYIKKLFK